MDLVVREFLEREQQLRIIGRLGAGGFAEVWKVETSSGVRSVVKVSLQPIDENNPTLKKELDNLRLVKEISGHPHVVSLVDYWVVAKHLLTRWELASGGDLLELWARCKQQGQPGIPVEELLPLIRDAADGLDFLHGNGIYHRDVKPQNLLLFQGRVKVGDLGLAKLVGASTASHTGLGTFGYLPPEAWEERCLTPTVDLYSLAATYLRLRTGNEPFGTNPVEILTRQQRGEPVLDGVGAAERPLLLAALDPNPAKRFSRGAQAWVEELQRAITRPPVAHGGVMQPALPAAPIPESRRVPPGLAIAPLDERAARGFQEAWAGHLRVPVLEENTIGMKLVLIPPGEFMMGSGESLEQIAKAFKKYRSDISPDWFRDEHPQHRVRITRPFYLGAYEVTVGLFRKFVEATGYKSEGEKDGRCADVWTGKGWQQDPRFNWRNPGFEQSDEHPVTCVSWNDAVAFCQWLSKKEGKTYRLPTEAEWEYACRAGTTTRYYNGDDPERLAEVGNVADATAKAKFRDWVTIAARDGYVFTAPVGGFKPNAWGLYDMHGNVWEWCADWYDPGYYSKSPPDDPVGPSSGHVRVLRGGSWFNLPWNSRSARRLRLLPVRRDHGLGFRVARTL
ncbi:MAG: SUMF1/EgtB/PvdO family nonheme iron enzyme [Bryobacteraceae bacterium]|nr:SUMF1/EgtB/PvdO family nonheme iron enzyme [Bryobacteraceae bacterium]